MALPPLVVSSQVIAASHINAIRNSLNSWSFDVNAGLNNLTNLNSLGVVAITASGSSSFQGLTATALTSSGAVNAASAAISGALSAGSISTATATLTGAINAASLTVTGAVASASITTGAVISSTGTFSGDVSAANFNATGNVTVGNSSGDSHNTMRLDGFTNTLFIVADSSAGAAVGTNIAFRATSAGVTAATDNLVIEGATGRVGINTAIGSNVKAFNVTGDAQIVSSGAGTFADTLSIQNTNAAALVQAGILRVVSANNDAVNSLMVLTSPSGYGLQVSSSGKMTQVGPAGLEFEMSSSGSAEMGLKFSDASRVWKTGINIGGAGAGRYTLYNITANAPIFSAGDTDATFHVNYFRISGALPGPYADNAAAIAAGLIQGRLYRDSSNNVKQVQ